MGSDCDCISTDSNNANNALATDGSVSRELGETLHPTNKRRSIGQGIGHCFRPKTEGIPLSGMVRGLFFFFWKTELLAQRAEKVTKTSQYFTGHCLGPSMYESRSP